MGGGSKFGFSLIKIIVRVGFRKTLFDRYQPIHFAYSENKHALHPFYRISYYLEMVVDDIRTITVDNIFLGQRARPIAANCNFLVSYTARNQDYDIDPQGKQRP